MEQITIHSVDKISPYTLKLNGYFRSHDKFYAELQGVCLEILVANPFNDKEKNELKEKLNEIFKSATNLDGTYDKRKINSIMSKNKGVIIIRVGE